MRDHDVHAGFGKAQFDEPTLRRQEIEGLRRAVLRVAPLDEVRPSLKHGVEDRGDDVEGPEIGGPTSSTKTRTRSPASSRGHPASLCPGAVHHAWVEAATGPTWRSADWPGVRSAVLGAAPAMERSWAMVPLFVTCRVRSAPAGTSIVAAVTENSASATSTSEAPSSGTRAPTPRSGILRIRHT